MVGGGGSGGSIRLVAPEIRGSGDLHVGGGDAFHDSNDDLRGRSGRVRLETHQNTYTGSVSGYWRYAALAPAPILVSTFPIPSIRVVSVGGVPVPAIPRGGFDLSDEPNLIDAWQEYGLGHAVHITGSTHKEDGMRDVVSQDVHERLATRLCDKIDKNRQNIIRYEEQFMDDSDVVVVCSGAASRPASSGSDCHL